MIEEENLEKYLLQLENKVNELNEKYYELNVIVRDLIEGIQDSNKRYYGIIEFLATRVPSLLERYKKNTRKAGKQKDLHYKYNYISINREQESTSGIESGQ